MARIVEQESTRWRWTTRCHKCRTKTEFTEDDLERDGFKEDPNTYWFDGSARSVSKYYVWCPNRCDIIFVPDDKVPEIVRIYVRNNGRELK